MAKDTTAQVVDFETLRLLFTQVVENRRVVTSAASPPNDQMTAAIDSFKLTAVDLQVLPAQ